MTEIIGVKFKASGKCYYFDPCGIKVEKNRHVIVETAQGTECGTCVIPNTMIEDELEYQLKKLIRIANEKDEHQVAENIKKQDEAFNVCNERIQFYGLPMKLVETECTFDNSKLLFYFTADGRIDFRELVKDLAATFRTRIEMRQVGARDEAKMLGGLGICGREFCCSGFLKEFEPVSIKMAKEQNLSLNPTKISGACGRLMCCLKYEQNSYEYLHKITPRTGAYVSTPGGKGTVESSDLITGSVKVRLDNSGDPIPKVYDRSELTVISSKPPAKKGDTSKTLADDGKNGE